MPEAGSNVPPGPAGSRLPWTGISCSPASRLTRIGGLNLQQGGTLFTWVGQRACGSVERSSHESLTTIG